MKMIISEGRGGAKSRPHVSVSSVYPSLRGSADSMTDGVDRNGSLVSRGREGRGAFRTGAITRTGTVSLSPRRLAASPGIAWHRIVGLFVTESGLELKVSCVQ